MTSTGSNPLRLSRYFASERRAWRGQTPLRVVFWGYGVAVSLVLLTLHATAFALEQWIFQQILILTSAAYTIWILVAIWRCAQRADPFWGMLARLLTVAWGLNTGFVLFFLQIELTVRHARG